MAHILVTDDSNFLRRRTNAILMGAGHAISEAGDGIECLRSIAENRPDVLFLDIVMPNMDGMAVLKELKDQGSQMPVIVLTADIQKTVKNECLQLGAAGFINKPPNEEQVLEALDIALQSLESGE